MEPIIMAQYPRVLPREDAPRTRIIFDTKSSFYLLQEFKVHYANGSDYSMQSPVVPLLRELKADKQWYHSSFNWQHYLFSLMLQGVSLPEVRTPHDFFQEMPQVVEELVHHQRLSADLSFKRGDSSDQLNLRTLSENQPELMILINEWGVWYDHSDEYSSEVISDACTQCLCFRDVPLSHYLTPSEWEFIISGFCLKAPDSKRRLLRLGNQLSELKVLDIYQLQIQLNVEDSEAPVQRFLLQNGKVEPFVASVPAICRELMPQDVAFLLKLLLGLPLELSEARNKE